MVASSAVILLVILLPLASPFTTPRALSSHRMTRAATEGRHLIRVEGEKDGGAETRRRFVGSTAAALALLGSGTAPSWALVKGSAPPPKKSKSERGSCKTIDECEEVGRQREEALFGSTEDAADVQKTDKGDRYKDLVVGSGPVADRGSQVSIKYRVLRLGKRSSDGLSGEASPVFSRGYGEDDDSEKDTLSLTLGQSNVVAAIDAGILGMQPGGRRRVNVDPRRGWKLPDSVCLRTDSAVSQAISLSVVPGTQVQENDACFAENLVPSPSNYGAKRRMLRRYDEALIVDIELLSVVGGKTAESASSPAAPTTAASSDDKDDAAREALLKKEGIF